jgi:hypothetical protein
MGGPRRQLGSETRHRPLLLDPSAEAFVDGDWSESRPGCLVRAHPDQSCISVAEFFVWQRLSKFNGSAWIGRRGLLRPANIRREAAAVHFQRLGKRRFGARQGMWWLGLARGHRNRGDRRLHALYGYGSDNPRVMTFSSRKSAPGRNEAPIVTPFVLPTTRKIPHKQKFSERVS